MFVIKYLRLLLFVPLFSMALNLASAQTKRALIFAIGNYPEDSGWQEISSVRDVSFVQKALEAQGFGDIKVIKDEGASVKGISNALEDLIARSNQGDIIVIHFSSHGEQVEDEKGNKINGLEECIVSFDAKLASGDGPLSNEDFEKLKAGYYREDLFGSYVNKLRAKLGKSGDLAVFMDLCHAGTGTRGSAKVRGGKPALVSRDFGKRKVTSGTAADYDVDAGIKTDESNMASYIVVGAARAEELDYETMDDNKQGVGSLSYAISKVFTNLGDSKNITYRALFAKIQGVMNEKNPLQHPVLSGNGADRQLFGGHFVPQKHFIAINKIAGLKLVLNAGTLSGLDAGAKIAVYPSGTNDTLHVRPLATGSVSSASVYTSTITLTKALLFTQPALGWVFVTSPVYKFSPLSIEIISNKSRGGNPTGAFPEADLLKIQKALKGFPLVNFDNIKPELKIKRGSACDSIIIAATGALFDTLKDASSDTSALKIKIKSYVQYGFLKALQINEPGIALDVKLVRVVNGKPDTSNVHSNTNRYAFAAGDTVMIWVHNGGAKGLYFNILDMQPNGVINPVVPIITDEFKISPEELFIKPGVSHVFNYPIELTPPLGTEVFKIFVSEKLIDMTSIANSGGNGSRGNFTALESLVKASYTVATRSAKPLPRLSGSGGSAYNLLFEIKDKK